MKNQMKRLNPGFIVIMLTLITACAKSGNLSTPSFTPTIILSPTMPSQTRTVPTPTPSSYLYSMKTLAVTLTDTFAADMIRVLPYSETVLYAPARWVLQEMDFKFTETTPAPDLSRQTNDAVNQTKTWRAFTACNPDLCQDKIFIENLVTRQIYEFQFGGRLLWRPITDLGWLDEHILAFSQWSQPRYGFRFALDVVVQDILLVVHMTDECFAYGKCD